MMTEANLLADIDAFLRRHNMSASRFGEEAAKDRHLVRRLRGGKSITLRKAQEVYGFMKREDDKSTA